MRRSSLLAASAGTLRLWLLLQLVSSGSVAAGRLRKGQYHRAAAGDKNATGADAESQLLREYPFYHTTAQLKSELQKLSGDCRGAVLQMRSVQEGELSLDVVSVTAAPPGQGEATPPASAAAAAQTNRVFLLAGEHARELIGPESALRFLRLLCGDDSSMGGKGGPVAMTDLQKAAGQRVDDGSRSSAGDVKALLQNSIFEVVVNANPRSRERVEQGEYCLRANPAGVDLNRNWDEEWFKPMELVTERGPFPFSEPETRLLKQLVEDFKPTTFLSIHSGTLGMYMPWAWSADKLASHNQKSMLSILQAVDEAHCKCPFGGAGKEVGYPCPGTSVDYVFDKVKTPYSFAFEIWGDPAESQALRQRWQEKLKAGGLALLQAGVDLRQAQFREVFLQQSSEFLHRHEGVDATTRMSTGQCFQMFNPGTAESFEETTRNWAEAYLEVTRLVSEDLQKVRSVV
eukprot:TRINITY_DN110778_c0_g1_i1.p1 TRINITY_DN110778_c0_g1~~TRINITY_DN110778_c0_g1_i1.p1  ORF type:complete len:458 (+),score=137.56 TRINITY_DN110778_c0_g1_i1:85-1458(+)